MLKTVKALAGVVAISFLITAPSSASSPDVKACPESFHSVALHKDAKLCQIFDDGMPATMVYHLPLPVGEAVMFYLQDNNMIARSTVRNRTLLSSQDSNQRVVVSPDGDGSQIDILIVKPKS